MNPFNASSPPAISQYTAQEIATLQNRLNKRLGPEFVSARPGASGSKVHYLAADKVINLANEVFGFNGWSSAIQNIQVDFVDENAQNGRISLGLSVTMRITLKDGTFHEDIGYGQIENCRGKAAAFEKAKKEGTTDALKRTLRTFGNVLGNCLYDKDFLSKVTKIKAGPTRWDINDLHRHSDYAPVKKEPSMAVDGPQPRPFDTKTDVSEAEFEDDFDGHLFDEADFSGSHGGNQEEVSAERQALSEPLKPPPSRLPSDGGTVHFNTNEAPPQKRRQSTNTTSSVPNGLPNAKNMPPPHGPLPTSNNSSNNNYSSSPGQPSAYFQPQNQPQPPVPIVPLSAAHPNSTTPQPQPPHHPPPGFYSARALDPIATTNPSANSHTPFNPHAESPSIRKTAGFDHRRSAPVPRNKIASASTTATTPTPSTTDPPPSIPSVPLPGHGNPNPPAAAAARDFINPAMDPNRKIGAPSPYRPPGGIGSKRPLAEVTNLSGVASVKVEGANAKKFRGGE